MRIIIILILLLSVSCYNEEVKLFEVAFERDTSISYYVFVENGNCVGGIPAPIRAKPSYYTSLPLTIVKRKNESVIEVYENGYFFLYGNIINEDEDNIYLSIPKQNTFFNDQDLAIEGYEDLCENKYIQGIVNKNTNSLELSILFIDELEGYNYDVQYMARLR